MILNPGFNLTLRPMKHPVFFEMFKIGIKNTWTVEEVDFSTDITDLRTRMRPSEQHLIKRLVAFFATGDSIVGNSLWSGQVHSQSKLRFRRQAPWARLQRCSMESSHT